MNARRLLLLTLGFLAILIGAVWMARSVARVIGDPGRALIPAVSDVVIAWTAVYGGTQTLRRKITGLMLLRVFFSVNLVLVIAAIAGLAYLIPRGYSHVVTGPAPLVSFPFTAGYAVFSILALALLFTADKRDFLPRAANDWHWSVVTALLSQLAPGLGRALTGNLWAGLGLFGVYSLLTMGSFHSDGPGGELLETFFLNFVVKFGLWSVFAALDWACVKKVLPANASVAG